MHYDIFSITKKKMTTLMKKSFCIMLVCLFIILGITTSKVYAYSDNMYVKIGLKYGGTASNSYTISFPRGICPGYLSDGKPVIIGENGEVTTVIVENANGSVIVSGITGAGEKLELSSLYGNMNCIMSVGYEEDGYFSFSGKSYRGGISYNLNSGTLNLINVVGIEKYLYGVINGELSHGNPIEALKAQTVAARSFTIEKMNTHNGYGFDLCPSTHCQVYHGMSGEYPKILQAVNETAGVTIKSKGKVVGGYYYKNSGGYTQSGEDVWGGRAEYLQAVKDNYSPEFKWTYKTTLSDISNKLNASGYNIGTVSKVSIEERNKSGAVSKLVFYGTNGNAAVTKGKVRTVLGGVNIKSTMFGFNNFNPLGNTQPVDRGVYAISKNTQRTVLTSSLWVMGSNQGNIETDVSNIYIADGKGKIYYGSDLSRASSAANTSVSDVTESVTSEEITFVGYGYGHGVGMPQDSIVEMAKQGFSYADILKYYYTDVEIE